MIVSVQLEKGLNKAQVLKLPVSSEIRGSEGRIVIGKVIEYDEITGIGRMAVNEDAYPSDYNPTIVGISSRNKSYKLIKMERKEVYRIIDGERDYQNTVRKANEKDTREDDEKSIADFIIYMEHTLEKAKTAIYTLDDDEALSLIRKITALGVATGESFGFPERKLQG